MSDGRMDEAYLDLLDRGLRELGIIASQKSLRAMLRHLVLVSEWNQVMNLTAITDPKEMLSKHAIDSATVLTMLHLTQGLRMLDVGSGAGFPGIVVKCLCPEISLSMMESSAKKCKVLIEMENQIMSEAHAAEGYQVICGRAEEFGTKNEHREGYDVVVARAVAELRVLSELCLPFCRLGGEFIALKGPGVKEELSTAKHAIRILGGEITEVKEMELPGGNGKRVLVKMQKTSPTPRKYPRRVGLPNRNPL